MDVLNFILGLVILVAVLGGAGAIIWFWWARPFLWALDAQSYGWALAIALIGPLAGLMYQGRVTGTVTVADPILYSKGDVVRMDAGERVSMARVLRKLPNGRLYVRTLGGRSTVRA